MRPTGGRLVASPLWTRFRVDIESDSCERFIRSRDPSLFGFDNDLAKSPDSLPLQGYVHRSAAMLRFCDAHADWLTVVQLPPYACELNATEGVSAHVKRDLGNLLAGTVDELAASAKRLLKRIQYRPELIDGFRAQTGLALDPQPP